MFPSTHPLNSCPLSVINFWSLLQIKDAHDRATSEQSPALDLASNSQELGGSPGGSAVKNPPANVGDIGSIPDSGVIPHAHRAPRPVCALQLQSLCSRALEPQLLSLCPRARVLQHERPLQWRVAPTHHNERKARAATKTESSQK